MQGNQEAESTHKLYVDLLRKGIQMAKMTQCERILRHMKDYGPIDPMTAIKDYGCMRLSARIADLKGMGYPIRTKRVTNKNRYGESTNYCVYSLIEEENYLC